MSYVSGEINSSPAGLVFVEGDFSSIRDCLDDALAEATWLTAADRPTIALAYRYLEYLEQAQYEDFEMLHKAMSVVGPNLQKTLASLGLNPEARGAISKGLEEKRSKVDELKARRERKEAAPG